MTTDSDFNPARSAFVRANADEPSAFRNAFGHFATGVAVATCRAPDEAAIGITINSLTSVSLDPALALFCLESRSTTLAQFMRAGHFALNILAEDQQDLSNRFAQDHALGEQPHEFWGTGAPILKGALAAADCEILDIYGGGDHRILVGRVLEVATSESDLAPLIYFKGGYGRIAP